MKKVKLYRFTIEHIEYMPVKYKPDIVTYLDLVVLRLSLLHYGVNVNT